MYFLLSFVEAYFIFLLLFLLIYPKTIHESARLDIQNISLRSHNYEILDVKDFYRPKKTFLFPLLTLSLLISERCTLWRVYHGKYPICLEFISLADVP